MCLAGSALGESAARADSGPAWTGCYIGGFAGLSTLGATVTDSPFIAGPSSDGSTAWNALSAPFETYDLTDRAAFGGAQIGCDVAAPAGVPYLVLGLVADIARTGLDDRATSQTMADTSAGLAVDWMGSARVRMGLTVDDLLVFGSGGLAWARADGRAEDLSSSPGPGLMSIGATSTEIGWTTGAGVEWRPSRSWSLVAEYLHTEIDGFSARGQAILPTTAYPNFAYDDLRVDTVRIGLNWHLMP
jgi:opacity protein-like surface antigen